MSRRIQRRARLARLFACLLLTVIGADLADADCDLPSKLSSASDATWQTAAPDAAKDACADFCVPDCFCCSVSVAAGPAAVPPAPVLVARIDPVPRERRPQGIRPVVDHPPLRLA